MPDTYGKRQRRDLRVKKVAAREERRVARNQRRELRAAGEIEEDVTEMKPLSGPRDLSNDPAWNPPDAEPLPRKE